MIPDDVAEYIQIQQWDISTQHPSHKPRGNWKQVVIVQGINGIGSLFHSVIKTGEPLLCKVYNSAL